MLDEKDYNCYEEVKVESWEDLNKKLNHIEKSNIGFVYRGQGGSEWKLQPSIERVNHYTDVYKKDLKRLEEDVFKLFSRNVHNYLSVNCYPSDNTKMDLEWIALMQHHGAPTRILDFTYSPYVAAFFAVDGCNYEDKDKYSAIWCVSSNVLNKKAYIEANNQNKETFRSDEFLLNDAEKFRNFINNIKEEPKLGIAEPRRSNQRLNIQQGLFIFANRLDIPFEEVFDKFRTTVTYPVTTRIYKILIPNGIKFEILGQLDLMNINQETLFPGLDGFSRSLVNRTMIRSKNLSNIEINRW